MRILPPPMYQNILFFIIRSSIRVYCSKSSTLFSNSLIIASFSFIRLFSSALSRWRSVTIACFRHYDLMIFFALQHRFEELYEVFVGIKRHFRRHTSGLPFRHCKALMSVANTLYPGELCAQTMRIPPPPMYPTY